MRCVYSSCCNARYGQDNVLNDTLKEYMELHAGRAEASMSARRKEEWVVGLSRVEMNEHSSNVVSFRISFFAHESPALSCVPHSETRASEQEHPQARCRVLLTLFMQATKMAVANERSQTIAGRLPAVRRGGLTLV